MTERSDFQKLFLSYMYRVPPPPHTQGFISKIFFLFFREKFSLCSHTAALDGTHYIDQAHRDLPLPP